MATKTGKTGNVGFFAFVAVIFVAVAYLFRGMQAAFNEWGWNTSWMGNVPGVLTWIAEIIMTLIIVYCSYDFAMRQSKPWRVIWWILAIIAICAVVGIGGFNAFR
ncbi:MAG: hypothetical protein K6G28_01060 [Acholeplasmatales bacterium]|nr:hypothetical protein [Acholeplasmatales bacterium]